MEAIRLTLYKRARCNYYLIVKYVISRVPGVENAWHCIDRATGVSVTWVEGKFNDTQSVAWPDDLVGSLESPAQLARVMRLMADWLFENHSELL